MREQFGVRRGDCQRAGASEMESCEYIGAEEIVAETFSKSHDCAHAPHQTQMCSVMGPPI